MHKLFDLPHTIARDDILIEAPSSRLAVGLTEALSESYTFHARFLSWPRADVTLENSVLSLEKSRKDFLAKSIDVEKKFYILPSHSLEVIGCVGIRFDLAKTEYSIGYWINYKFSQKGYMSKALRVLLPFLNDNPVTLTTSEFNEPSRKLAEALGFELVNISINDRVSPIDGVHNTLLYRTNKYVKPC